MYTDCTYNTPKKRRERLVALGRCQACLVPTNEHGTECADRAKCNDHPREKHVYWTCDGPNSNHPGPQAAIRVRVNRA